MDVAMFQLNLLVSTLGSLKAMEPDLLSIGVDPRSILAIGMRKQADIHKMIVAEFPHVPEEPPVMRAFHGMCEFMFPSEGAGVLVPLRTRMAHMFEVVRRLRPSVMEAWSTKAA